LLGQPRPEPGNRDLGGVNLAAGLDQIIGQIAALLARSQHQLIDLVGARFNPRQRGIGCGNRGGHILTGGAGARLDDFEQANAAFGQFGHARFGFGEGNPLVGKLLSEGAETGRQAGARGIAGLGDFSHQPAELIEPGGDCLAIGHQLRGIGNLGFAALGQRLVERGEPLSEEFAGLCLAGFKLGLAAFDLFKEGQVALGEMFVEAPGLVAQLMDPLRRCRAGGAIKLVDQPEFFDHLIVKLGDGGVKPFARSLARDMQSGGNGIGFGGGLARAFTQRSKGFSQHRARLRRACGDQHPAARGERTAARFAIERFGQPEQRLLTRRPRNQRLPGRQRQTALFTHPCAPSAPATPRGWR